MKDDYTAIDKTMNALELMNIPLKRSAVCVMLEDGMLTQETQFTYYLLAYNLYNLFTNKENISFEQEINLVIKGMSKKEKKEYSEKWANIRNNISL